MHAIGQGGKKNYKPSSLNNQLYSEKSLIFVSLFPLLFESCQPHSSIFLQSFFYYYLSIFITHYHWTFLCLKFQCLMQFPMPFQASELLQPHMSFFLIDLPSSFLLVMSTLTLEGWKPVTETYISFYYWRSRVKG